MAGKKLPKKREAERETSKKHRQKGVIKGGGKHGKKKRLKPRSPLLREFFISGLSRKGHAHKPRTAYDRRKLRKDLERRLKDADERG